MAESAISVDLQIGQGHYTESQIDDIVDRMQRPTTSHSRRSRLWSRERRFYEQQELEAAILAGKDVYRGVLLSKHYPGTWRSADQREVQDIVNRVNKPTVSYKLREASTQIYWPVWKRPQKGEPVKSTYMELPECPKSARFLGSPTSGPSVSSYRSKSAVERLSQFKHCDENPFVVEKASRQNQNCQKHITPANQRVPKGQSDKKPREVETKNTAKKTPAQKQNSTAPTVNSGAQPTTTAGTTPQMTKSNEGVTMDTATIESKEGEGQAQTQGLHLAGDQGQPPAQPQAPTDSQGQNTEMQEERNIATREPSSDETTGPALDATETKKGQGGNIEGDQSQGQEQDGEYVTNRRRSSKGSRKKSGKRKKSKGNVEESDDVTD